MAEELRLAETSPVALFLEHRFGQIGNSFLNLVDSEDLWPVISRSRSRSCPCSLVEGHRGCSEGPLLGEAKVCQSHTDKGAQPLVNEGLRPCNGLDEAPSTGSDADSKGVSSFSTQYTDSPLHDLDDFDESDETLWSSEWSLEEITPFSLRQYRSGAAAERMGRSVQAGPAFSEPEQTEDAPYNNAYFLSELMRAKQDGLRAADTSGKMRAHQWVTSYEGEAGEEPVKAASSLPACLGAGQAASGSSAPVRPAAAEAAVRKASSLPCKLQQPAGKQKAAEAVPKEVQTLMIQNLPKNMTQQNLVDELDAFGFAGTYDFLYLPSVFKTNTTHGYAFVNFQSTVVAQRLVQLWDRRRPFSVVNEASLYIIPAIIQGFEANMARWNTAKMRRVRNPEHRPLVLRAGGTGAATPPREMPAAPAAAAGARQKATRRQR